MVKYRYLTAGGYCSLLDDERFMMFWPKNKKTTTSAADKVKLEQDMLNMAIKDAENEPVSFIDHPPPWTAGATYFDGAGVMFFDANDKPIFTELIYHSPDTCAVILKTFNSLRTDG